MSENTNTVQLRHRLVSFDGGENFKSGFALTPQELDANWEALLSAMDPKARSDLERTVSPADRKGFLVRYLATAPAHLILGAR